VIPALKAGRAPIIVAHGNSIRALIKHLDSISDDEITALNIPTGIPLVYELDDDFNAVKNYYLADSAQLDSALNEVAHQTSASH
ncbi:MAG TPA: 2,3-bisphosphoglycerate-dependent phosphoglycerate mutase, partial [Arenicellales bacterium]|nr:2,3-bisphosphoglycerate-dependent phosphoglycerate mutase [Arenicellales bacterium]